MCYFLSLNTELNEFMELLVSRLSKKPLLQGMVAKKVMILGDPSKSLPPNDAPTWAVHTTESKFISISICMNELMIVFIRR